MSNQYVISEETLQGIADSIREKTGKTEEILCSDFSKEILGIQGEGLDTSDATASPYCMLEGTTAYVKGEKITGIVPGVDIATEFIARTSPYVYLEGSTVKLVLSGLQQCFLLSGLAGSHIEVRTSGASLPNSSAVFYSSNEFETPLTIKIIKNNEDKNIVCLYPGEQNFNPYKQYCIVTNVTENVDGSDITRPFTFVNLYGQKTSSIPRIFSKLNSDNSYTYFVSGGNAFTISGDGTQYYFVSGDTPITVPDTYNIEVISATTGV